LQRALAISASTGVVTSEGRVLQGGRRVATAEARLTDSRGTLLAHATATTTTTTTCLVFPRA